MASSTATNVALGGAKDAAAHLTRDYLLDVIVSLQSAALASQHALETGGWTDAQTAKRSLTTALSVSAGLGILAKDDLAERMGPGGVDARAAEWVMDQLEVTQKKLGDIRTVLLTLVEASRTVLATDGRTGVARLRECVQGIELAEMLGGLDGDEGGAH